LRTGIVGDLLNWEGKGIREWNFPSPPKGYWILRDRQMVFRWDLRPRKRNFNHLNWGFGHFFSERRLFALKISERTATREFSHKDPFKSYTFSSRRLISKPRITTTGIRIGAMEG
jgi:hypothetical protein